MPDIYVDTDVSPGGSGTAGDPYASWDEAWEAEDANITAPGTYNFFFRGTAEDTASRVRINAYPASGTGDLVLNFCAWHTEFGAASDADDGWYQGDANWSTAHYRINHTAGSNNRPVIEVSGDDETTYRREVNFKGLQIDKSGTTWGNNIVLANGCSGTVNIIGCRFKHSTSGDPARHIRLDDFMASALHVNVKNNIFIYDGSSDFSCVEINNANTTADIYNNTAYFGASVPSGSTFVERYDNPTLLVDVQNNVAFSAAGAASISTSIAGTESRDYNAATASADRGANGFDVATGDFTSAGTGDSAELTPAASQTNAWGAGGETNGDNSKVPTTDIRGTAREAGAGNNTAIGAFEAAGGGASSDTEVSAAAESLTLATSAASVAFDVGISAAADTLSLTTSAATVAYGMNVAANTEALTVSTHSATITEDIGVSAATGNLTLTTNAAAVSFDVNVSAATDALTVTTYPASLSQATEIAAQTASLSLTAYPAAITYDVAVEATTAALSASTHAATIVQSGAVLADTVALALEPRPATISLDAQIAAGTGNLTLSTKAATIEYGVDVSAAVEALALVSNAAIIAFDVDIPASAAALNITTYAALIGSGTRRAATEAQSQTFTTGFEAKNRAFAIGPDRRTRATGNDGKSYAQ